MSIRCDLEFTNPVCTANVLHMSDLLTPLTDLTDLSAVRAVGNHVFLCTITKAPPSYEFSPFIDRASNCSTDVHCV